MNHPDERAFDRAAGKGWREAYEDVVRAGRFSVGNHDWVNWLVHKYPEGFRVVNEYFTSDEAWDSAWEFPFATEQEAVKFARKRARIAERVMKKSHKAHGRAFAEEVAAVVNQDRWEPPPIFK